MMISLWHFITAVLLTVLLLACNRSNEPLKISLCQDGTIAPLLLLAQEKGYYGIEGLEISFHPMGDGKLAMDAFLDGKCDAAVIAEPAIVERLFKTQDFVIIATVGSSDNASRIVADRRSGIKTAKDLKGKKTAVRKGEISHFFLDMFLAKNDIRPEQVTIKFLEPQQLSEALITRQIDAYAASDIYLAEGVRRLGDNAVVLSEPGLCRNSSSMLLKKSDLKARPNIAASLLKALLKAEKRAAEAPEELVSLVAKRREISVESARSIITEQNLVVSLPQQMLPGMDDYAVWMKEQGLAPSGRYQGVTGIIEDTALKNLSPAAVTIKH